MTTDKLTRAQIESKVTALNRLLGLPLEPYTHNPDTGRNTANIGNIHVEHGNGGFNIYQMRNEGGAVSQPLGEGRFTALECWQILNAACEVVKMAQAQRLERAA